MTLSFCIPLTPLKLAQYQNYRMAQLERKVGIVFVLHAIEIKEINLNERHNWPRENLSGNPTVW